MDTHFAPAGRDSLEQLRRRVDVVENAPLLQAIMEALPTPVLVLNQNRQMLAANRRLLKMLGVEAGDVLGKRPGEILGCTYWREGPDGCGTTRHCLTCGAVDAIWTSQQSRGQAVRECRVTLDTAINGGALDLRVTAAPMEVDDEKLTVCTLEDVSQQKRLDVLTRVFFHDVLNTAGGIHGYAHLLGDRLDDDVQSSRDFQRLGALAARLVDEIESQRDLMLAESGDLQINPQAVRTTEVLGDLETMYSAHAVGADRTLRNSDVWDGRFVTDVRLLARVLGNMLKNALEATEPGGVVTIGCGEQGREVAFSVHNESAMPEEIRLQVFHRSFSTKGQAGRGVGTYSMKLLGERYLGGRVEFTSKESEGTTFTLTLPNVLLHAPAAKED